VLDDVQNWQSSVSGPRIGELNAISLFFLWPPIVMGRPLYFCPVISIILSSFMAALCNRAGHVYFHPVVSSFFPQLISVVGDWMSTILPHMVWP